MRKSISSLLSAGALLAAGQASAGLLNAPNEIFVGGATAVQETFQLDVLLRFCDYNPANQNIIVPEVYVDALVSSGGVLSRPGNGDGSAATPALKHRNQQVVHCNFKQSLGGSLAGARVAVYKYNGGSGTGVAPVSQPEITPDPDKRYLDASPAGCVQDIPLSNPGPDNTYLSVDGATRFKLYLCPNASLIKIQAPDGGISDVEPKVFVGQLATGFGQSVPGISPDKDQNDWVDRGNLIVKSGPGIVFGVAATLQFYDELLNTQKAAGLLPGCGNTDPVPPTPQNPTGRNPNRDTLACMPSFPTPLVQSVATGEISSWATRPPYGLTLNTAGVNQGAKVNFCRRTAGSGTHAQFMINFLRTNCIAGSPAVRTFANNVALGAPAPQVYENEGSGNIDQCMDALDSGNGYNGGFANGLTDFPNAPTPTNGGNSSVVPSGRTAFGFTYNSLERNTGLVSRYRFLKIDFIAPTLQNAFNGAYHDIYYLSYQNRVDAQGNPTPLTGGIRTVAATPSQIQVLKDFFAIWNSPTPAAVQAVNNGLIFNPDGIANNGDEWQGGLLSPSRTAPQVFSGGPVGTDPRTPWARETATGTADSCQELSYKNL